MFNKLIKVTISLITDKFVSGSKSAKTAFQRLASSIKSGGSIIKGSLQALDAAMGIVAKGLRTLGDVAGFVKRQFLDTAVAIERQERIFKSLTGSGEQAADMIEFLEETALKYGLSLDGLSISAQQVAVALRSVNGEVDPAQFEELTLSIAKLAALRPDVSMDLWGRAISGLLAGDLTTMTRALDINISSLEGFSEEAQNFINQGKKATEEGLGSVTRLGESAGSSAADGMAFLRELLEMAGATDETLAASVTTYDLLIARVDELKRDMGEKLLPTYERLLELAIEFLEENEEGIGSLVDGIGLMAEKFADFLDEGGLSEFSDNIRDTADTIKGIAGFFNDGLVAGQQMFILLGLGAEQLRKLVSSALTPLAKLLDSPAIIKMLEKAGFDTSGLGGLGEAFEVATSRNPLAAIAPEVFGGPGGLIGAAAQPFEEARQRGERERTGISEETQNQLDVILHFDADTANFNIKAAMRNTAQETVDDAFEDFAAGIAEPGGGGGTRQSEVL